MYFVALVLPEALNRQVLQWKQYFHEAYGCTVGLKSPAHITLVPPYWMQQVQEPALTATIDEFARHQHTFPLTTHGFNAFAPRTIFVAVQESESLQQLKHQLDKMLLAHPSLPVKKENRRFHPHITLATRDLQKHQFFEAWPQFKDRQYSMDWQVTGISILRHNGRHWDVIHTADMNDSNDFSKTKG